MASNAIYLRHESGANHEFGGRRAAKLIKELKAGRGGPECLTLEMSGYLGFVGTRNGEVGVWSFEDITAEDFGK